MPQFLVSFAANIDAEDEDEAKGIAMRLMESDDIWYFNEQCHAVIERIE